MDFDPDDARQYLEGVDYPASKDEVVNAAGQNGAPDTMLRMLEGLSRPEFSGPEEVMEDLRAFPQSN
jgi:ABC-type transport system involved in cytochrome c biogenesis ATPase subunit